MNLGEHFTSSLVIFTGIFAVVDPFTAVPVFLAVTGTNTPAERRSMARRASFAALLILASFALAGGLLFKFFGVTLAAFKIAGGLAAAADGHRHAARPALAYPLSPEETQEGAHKEDVAIFPLATPLLAGPGSIATTMVFIGRATAWRQTIPVLRLSRDHLPHRLLAAGFGLGDRPLAGQDRDERAQPHHGPGPGGHRHAVHDRRAARLFPASAWSRG